MSESIFSYSLIIHSETLVLYTKPCRLSAFPPFSRAPPKHRENTQLGPDFRLPSKLNRKSYSTTSSETFLVSQQIAGTTKYPEKKTLRDLSPSLVIWINL